MPSYLHELLLLLFRNRSGSAADLLRELDVQLPEYDEVRTESSDLSNIQPTEYRADLVLFLVRGAQKVLGVIVEVQLGCDKNKPYTWPAYIRRPEGCQSARPASLSSVPAHHHDRGCRGPLGRKTHRSGAGYPLQPLGSGTVEYADGH
jgi:hypothetical protein